MIADFVLFKSDLGLVAVLEPEGHICGLCCGQQGGGLLAPAVCSQFRFFEHPNPSGSGGSFVGKMALSLTCCSQFKGIPRL